MPTDASLSPTPRPLVLTAEREQTQRAADTLIALPQLLALYRDQLGAQASTAP